MNMITSCGHIEIIDVRRSDSVTDRKNQLIIGRCSCLYDSFSSVFRAE
jgi:hypothetical protein